MNTKMFLNNPLKADTPNEEELGGTPQKVRATPSQDSQTVSEKVGSPTGVTPQSGGMTDEEGVNSEHDAQDFSGTASSVHSDNLPDVGTHGPRHIFSRIFSSVFPSPSDEEEIQAYVPHYRVLPILSGITIPFCILLEIPGLTTDWYIRTEGSTIVASKPNPPLLDVGIALSILCAVLANICLVVRFLERRIKAMTILCTVFLSIHDTINIAVLATFGAMKGDYTFSQAFWLTLCSTIASMFTNVTLMFDLIRTPDFKRSGSGLTRRQRSLVIIVIGLFCYIALGALANSLLLDLSFINGLYFTIVTIETIGFGDIVPTSRGSRVFVCLYATLGVINLAFVIGYVRQTVLEGLDFGYRRRVLVIQERRRAVHRRRHAERRWRHAIIWRLRERHAPTWVPKNTNGHQSIWSNLASCFWRAEWRIRSAAPGSAHHGHQHGMQLNLWALPQRQLEAAALEAGAPLDTLLPAGFYDTYDQDARYLTDNVDLNTLPSWFMVHPVYHRDELATGPLTHRRLGAMAAIVTRMGLAVYGSSGDPLPNGHDNQDASAASGLHAFPGSTGSFQTTSEDGEYHADVADTEKKAYYTRSSLSWIWFLIFWMGGAAIFKATEGWTYGVAVYFCFISFTTIGYGDLTPTTPASRAIFVVWALVGVATMTTFISVVSEAYTSRYQGILGRNSFNHVVQQYRERSKTELNEKVQRLSTSTGVKFVLHDTIEHEEASGTGDEPLQVSATDDGGTAPAVASTSKLEPDPDIEHVEHVQRSLEQLPQQVLTETRSIQQYSRLINDFDGHLIETQKFVDESVWSLIDDVMGGRRLAECSKMDLLRDGQSRQTLMMLGIERSLKELVNISEQAIAAIRERDRIIAALEREKEQYEEEGEQRHCAPDCTSSGVV